MSDTKREVEARGADVEAAVAAGLEILGVDRSDVIVEVVDEGSRGLLGIGSREAVVRLTSLVASVEISKEEKSPEKPTTVPVTEQRAARHEIDEADEGDGQIDLVAVEVMRELMKGLSNKEIAADLGITEATVSFHLNQLKKKLGARTNRQLLAKASKLGLVQSVN